MFTNIYIYKILWLAAAFACSHTFLVVFSFSKGTLLQKYSNKGIKSLLSTNDATGFRYMNTMGRLLKRVLNFSQGLSVVSNTFEQNINLGFDLVFVLITDPFV